MTNAEFIASNWSIGLTVTLAWFATYWCWVGAMRGQLQHRVARTVLSCGITTIAAGFTALFVWDYDDAASVSRVGLWVLCVGLAWSAISGIRAGQQMQSDARRLDRLENVIDKLPGANAGDGDGDG